MYVFMDACMCMYVYVCVVCMYECMYVCMYVCMYESMYVWVYVCITYLSINLSIYIRPPSNYIRDTIYPLLSPSHCQPHSPTTTTIPYPPFSSTPPPTPPPNPHPPIFFSLKHLSTDRQTDSVNPSHFNIPETETFNNCRKYNKKNWFFKKNSQF